MLFIESEVVELKSKGTADICKEVIAFANSKGGRIYIGVEDDGSIAGVEEADLVILQLNNMIRDSIKPDITMFVHYETVGIEDKSIIEITIQKGTDRPYYLGSKGLKPSGVYVRNGNSADSVCRIPKLAAIFYRLELIEAYGTGMPKIMKSYLGIRRQPKIEVTSNAFRITLRISQNARDFSRGMNGPK